MKKEQIYKKIKETHLYLLIHDTSPSLTFCKKEVTKDMQVVENEKLVTCKVCLSNINKLENETIN